MDTTQQKISNWLANPDCDTDFNSLVNFLTDECGVVLKPEEEICRECECIIGASDFDFGCYCSTEEEEEQKICETCDKHYDDCETCECVNDCMCLELCKKENPHLYDEGKKEQKMDYWVANGGTIEFITCTLPEVMDAGHEEWGDLCNFVDSRK